MIFKIEYEDLILRKVLWIFLKYIKKCFGRLTEILPNLAVLRPNQMEKHYLKFTCLLFKSFPPSVSFNTQFTHFAYVLSKSQ